MKQKGFTLIELLAILVVLGIIATIATPIVQKTLKDNKEKVYNIVVKQLIDYTRDYMAKYPGNLPDNEGEFVIVKLETLKKEGLAQINITNPKTNKVISNQSEIKVTREDNNYVYDVGIYDLVSADKVASGAPVVVLQTNSPLTCEANGSCNLENVEGVSRQILKDDKEVSSISLVGTYTVYYSKLENGKLGISTRTVIVQ